jgi:hypothetical protein
MFVNCLLSLKKINKINYFDLHKLHIKDDEVLLYPGKYDCDIENFFNSSFYKEASTNDEERNRK